MFQEVDVVDPRHFRECSIVEYVEQVNPDVVIMEISPHVIYDARYGDFGVNKILEGERRETIYTTIMEKDVGVEKRDDWNYNYAAIPIETNSYYRLKFDDVKVFGEGSPGIAICLYDSTTKTQESSKLFDLEYCREKGKFEWNFKTPQAENTLQLLFYAGMPGSTAGNEVVYKNVSLEKQILAEEEKDRQGVR